MHVMGFGTYSTTAHPRVVVLLEGLSALGADVTQVNVPLRLDTADRVRILKHPWRIPKLVRKLLSSWARLARATLRLRVAGRGDPDALLVGYMGHFDVLLARLLFPRTPLALDMLIFAADTARDRGERGRLKLACLSLLDGIAMSVADVIILDTEENLRFVSARLRRKAVVAAVGASQEWHRPSQSDPADPDTGKPLSVIFFGLFTPLQGTPTIGKAIHELRWRSDIRFTMIGNGQDYRETRSAAGSAENVEWIDWTDTDSLQSLVRDADVCLGIFGTTSKALHVVPNKVFQGAASGCAVVTSDTAPQRRMLGDTAVFVLPGDPLSLATALKRLADNRREVTSLQRRARLHASTYFTPAAVAEPLYRRLRPMTAVKSA